MTVKELNIGDVFRVAGEEQLWRKVGTHRAHAIPDHWAMRPLDRFRGAEIELVERAEAADIRRVADTLVLKGGEVTLGYLGAWRVHRCTPGDPLTEFVLTGGAFFSSWTARPAEDTALAFSVLTGAKHLNRPRGSDVFAYRGRVYARATTREAGGGKKTGGYRLVRLIDGHKRMIIAGLLTLPGEFALYDIIMEHFGPDTVGSGV